MDSNPSSPSPPLHIFMVNVLRVSPINPPKTHKLPATSTIIFFFFIIFFLIVPTTTSLTPTPDPNPNPKPKTQISYSKHCNHIVPDSPLHPTTSFSRTTAQSLRLQTGFFTGGDRILGLTPQSTTDFPKSFTFFPYYAHKEEDTNVYKIQAQLRLQIPITFSASSNSVHRRLRQFRIRGPRIPVGRGAPGFDLTGFWSESTGMLCMVGTGLSSATGNLRFLNVVLKLNYPKNASIFNSLVSGILESLDEKGSSNYFEPIQILGVPQYNENYEYSLIQKEKENGCLSGYDGGENFSLNEFNQGVCSVLGEHNHRFELEYVGDCDNASCNPVGGSGGYIPNVMYFKGIRCMDKQKMQMLLGFRNSSSYAGTFPFDPNTTLIAEGAWDEKDNRLCAVACRILNFTDSLTNASVGDCSIKFSLRFPSVLSIRNRSSMVGQIWSNRTVNDSGYFSRIKFHSFGELLTSLPGLKYKYTEIDAVRKSCANKNIAKHKEKTYPDGYSLDMRFDLSMRNRKGQIAWGYASPLFVGDKLYGPQLYGRQLVPPVVRPIGSAVQLSDNQSSFLNISYKMSFTPTSGFKFGGEIAPSKAVEISAEGMYNRDTGVLCMTGCRRLGSSHQILMKNGSLDCGIVFNIQFPPLNAEDGDLVKGMIESTRAKSDPLYFDRLDLSSNSIYTSQAKESIWRMDLEITMVLISNTLACVFVGLQLFYVKKHPDVLPSISVVMLIVLTLGHMIPLLLNYEALFKSNRNQQNVFLGSGGWLEVNEIIVRVVTMVAFLLQFRLLQLTWSARQNDGSQNGLWVSEKKVLYVTLPLYIVCGLIAWSVHEWKKFYQSPFLRPRSNAYLMSYEQHSLWVDLKAYGGLVLDGFLLPQIMFNIFFNSREKALDASFYIGTSLVRLMPHAYDLYRAHSSPRYLDLSYIYANHRMDLYSTAWDIIIPCGGLLFAVLIYLQQRFGGQCILPKRFRENSVYEKVPVVELQGESIHKSFDSL